MTPRIAGVALDALVAEKILGWELRDKVWFDALGYRVKRNYLPCFSVEIQAAWLVLENVITRANVTRVAVQTSALLRTGWNCRISQTGDKLALIDCDDFTAPMAICCAALEVVRTQSPEIKVRPGETREP